MSEFRYDLLNNEQVIIAPNRLTRPNLFQEIDKKSDEKTLCPFCSGHEDMTPPEIFSLKAKNSSSWDVRVVPNLYKAVQIEATDISNIDGIYEKRDGFGAHEIIIDTPKHIVCFEDLSTLQMKDWLNVIKLRVEDLKKDIRLTYFCIFKNQGQNSGATLPHVHTQLIAMPLIPKNELSNLKYYFNHYKTHGRSIFKDIVDYELEQNKRVINESANFISFCPYASAFSFEVMIMPKVKISSVDALDKKLLDEISELLKDSLSKLKVQIGNFDYNLYIQNPPMQKSYETEEFFDEIDEFYRFYIRIIPRIYKIGGFELQSKIHINPLSPENAAELLKSTVI